MLEKPRDPDALISEADFVRDERLPYWADLWPSAIVLAEHVLAAPRAAGRALELGCGLGLVTIAAQRSGREVTATDYYEDALLFTARNARSATGVLPRVRMVDWRDFPRDLGRFDLVLAADVLYERDYGPLVASVVARTLAPGGVALVADQGRVALGSFLEACAVHGLQSREVLRTQRPGHGATSSGAKHTITIHEVRRDLATASDGRDGGS